MAAARQAPPNLSSSFAKQIELDQKERFFALSPEQIAQINPNTKTAPVFRSRADAESDSKDLFPGTGVN